MTIIFVGEVTGDFALWGLKVKISGAAAPHPLDLLFCFDHAGARYLTFPPIRAESKTTTLISSTAKITTPEK
jgi:hypothetical protein